MHICILLITDLHLKISYIIEKYVAYLTCCQDGTTGHGPLLLTFYEVAVTLCAAISLLLALGKIVVAVDVASQLIVVVIRLHHCFAFVADVNTNIAILKRLHV